MPAVADKVRGAITGPLQFTRVQLQARGALEGTGGSVAPGLETLFNAAAFDARARFNEEVSMSGDHCLPSYPPGAEPAHPFDSRMFQLDMKKWLVQPRRRGRIARVQRNNRGTTTAGAKETTLRKFASEQEAQAAERVSDWLVTEQPEHPAAVAMTAALLRQKYEVRGWRFQVADAPRAQTMLRRLRMMGVRDFKDVLELREAIRYLDASVLTIERVGFLLEVDPTLLRAGPDHVWCVPTGLEMQRLSKFLTEQEQIIAASSLESL